MIHAHSIENMFFLSFRTYFVRGVPIVVQNQIRTHTVGPLSWKSQKSFPKKSNEAQITLCEFLERKKKLSERTCD